MKALINIQSELKAPKSQYNKFGGFYYRSVEDILEGLKPLLLEHECQLFMSDSIEQVADRIYIKATATITDGEQTINVSAYARESESKKGMDDSQVSGSTSSYARKYALNGLFLIDDTKDADYYNQNDKKQKKGVDKSQLLDEIEKAKTYDELKAIWNKAGSHKQAIKSALTKKKESLKPKLTPDSQEWMEIIAQLAGNQTTTEEVEKKYTITDKERLNEEAMQAYENMQEKENSNQQNE